MRSTALTVAALLASAGAGATEPSSWADWQWTESCSYTYGDATLGDGPLEERECVWQLTTTEGPDPDPDPDPDPEPETSHISGQTGWDKLANATLEGNPVDTMTLTRGEGPENARVGGTQPAVIVGQKYSIGYDHGCFRFDTRISCKHRFQFGSTGEGVTVESGERVDEELTAKSKYATFILMDAEPETKLIVWNLTSVPVDAAPD